MSELYIDPLPSSDVSTPVDNAAEDNVDASGKNSLNQNLDVPNPAETLGLKDPAVSGNLGKNVPNSAIAVDANIETPADKVVNENPEVIIVNKTTVSDKAGKSTGRKPLYGPPKPVSKVVPRSEEKEKARKRKAPPTSDSDFEPETDVAASGSTSRKSIGRKKVSQSVPYAPLDNVSFHLENGSARWKFVYHRRLALERNLKEDILQCQSVVEAIEYAGLMKTVCGLDKQVFVRGKCVKFSPTVINQHLLRSSDEVAALKVTDNEVCKVLTGGRIKVWPTKAKLAATSLSPFYVVLNRIAAHNWVPTTHSGDVARGLGKFIYDVGTKAKFDYGSYFFQETLSHALTYAVEKPVALPTLLCVGTSVQAGVLSRKQMIADLTETSRALEAEEAAENSEGEPDGQEGEETSGSDDDTEDLEEDSDESSSI
ncbi:uncharacterized protein LOC123892261 [Trifolium pratense]|uniref:uncharacterized protein LOC123892261 n=1 Tax=Trifolium pratense TaxID=57577 RepID=UPI001E690378|nr:uncharacterized protein LOC123892261 [Trifolium pratense]